jgi:hypothetical protein
MGSAIPLCGHRTCCGIEEERVLASVSTIVVVAGQTQMHVVTLATVRPAIVPPIVPRLRPSGTWASQNWAGRRVPREFRPRRSYRSGSGVPDVCGREEVGPSESD